MSRHQTSDDRPVSIGMECNRNDCNDSVFFFFQPELALEISILVAQTIHDALWSLTPYDN